MLQDNAGRLRTPSGGVFLYAGDSGAADWPRLAGSTDPGGHSVHCGATLEPQPRRHVPRPISCYAQCHLVFQLYLSIRVPMPALSCV